MGGTSGAALRRRYKQADPERYRQLLERENAARRKQRKTETAEEREARLAKHRARHKKWRDRNADRLKAYRDADRAKNMDRIRKTTRAYSIKYSYGISLEDYERLRALQGDRCAICNTDKAARIHTDHSWRVDHCHETGEVRGLLCHNCNIAMGLLKENTTTLQQMINYLNHHKEEKK